MVENWTPSQPLSYYYKYFAYLFLNCWNFEKLNLKLSNPNHQMSIIGMTMRNESDNEKM
jgi:hypothetical protein